MGELAGIALGSGLDFLNNQFVGAQQRQHDKDMAAINNQYMIDQWQRENAYNLPSKVAQRYRSAGINPRAVFGQGSASGAGVAGSLSSAPGSSSSLGGYGAFAGLGSNLLTAERIESQNKKDDAEAVKAYEDAKLKSLQRQEAEFMKINGAWQSRLTDEKSKSLVSSYNAYMRKIDSDFYEFEHQTDLQNKFNAGVQLISNILKTNEEIERIIKLNEVSEADRELLISQKEKNIAESKRITADNEFFAKFGFYPAQGSSLESALVGLGAKGISAFSSYFKNPKNPRYSNVITEQVVNDWKDAKTPEQKKRVVQRAQSNAMNYPLSRGMQ